MSPAVLGIFLNSSVLRSHKSKKKIKILYSWSGEKKGKKVPCAHSEKLATLTSVHKRNSEIGEWWEKVFLG